MSPSAQICVNESVMTLGIQYNKLNIKLKLESQQNAIKSGPFLLALGLQITNSVTNKFHKMWFPIEPLINDQATITWATQLTAVQTEKAGHCEMGNPIS